MGELRIPIGPQDAVFMTLPIFPCPRISFIYSESVCEAGLHLWEWEGGGVCWGRSPWVTFVRAQRYGSGREPIGGTEARVCEEGVCLPQPF